MNCDDVCDIVRRGWLIQFAKVSGFREKKESITPGSQQIPSARRSETQLLRGSGVHFENDRRVGMSGDLRSPAKDKLFGSLHVELNQSYSIYALFPDYFVEGTSDYFLRVYGHALWSTKREAVWTLPLVGEPI